MYTNLNVKHLFLDRQIGTVLKYKLYKKYMDYNEKVFEDCNYLGKAAKLPFREETVYGNTDDPVTIFMLPGFLLRYILF